MVVKHRKSYMKSNIKIVEDYLNGDRPLTVFGYNGNTNNYHKEGDVWNDTNGIEWRRENGRNIRLTKSQADIIREAIGRQKCKCGQEIRFGNKFDKIFFAKTGMCQDCLIDYEHKLRLAGIFGIYERWNICSNQVGYLKDIKSRILETIGYFSKTDGTIEVLCNSEGFMEKFHGNNKEMILENAKRDLKECNKLLRAIEKQKNEAKKELKRRASEFKIKIYG